MLPVGETARVYRMDEAEKGCVLKSEGGGKEREGVLEAGRCAEMMRPSTKEKKRADDVTLDNKH